MNVIRMRITRLQQLLSNHKIKVETQPIQYFSKKTLCFNEIISFSTRYFGRLRLTHFALSPIYFYLLNLIRKHQFNLQV